MKPAVVKVPGVFLVWDSPISLFIPVTPFFILINPWPMDMPELSRIDFKNICECSAIFTIQKMHVHVQKRKNLILRTGE